MSGGRHEFDDCKTVGMKKAAEGAAFSYVLRYKSILSSLAGDFKKFCLGGIYINCPISAFSLAVVSRSSSMNCAPVKKIPLSENL